MSTQAGTEQTFAAPSQDSDSRALQPIRSTQRKYKPRKSNKPATIQAAILSKRTLGESKLSIAKDLGIAYNTVDSVLELNNFEASIEAGRRSCVTLIPKSIQAIENRLDKGDGVLGIKLLEDLGVIGEKSIANSQKNGLGSVFSQCQVLIQQPLSVTPQPEQSLQQPIPPQLTDNKGQS